MSANVWPAVPSEALWKTRLSSSNTALRNSYWMSFLHNGMPSSFFRCLILLPEYTELTLPFALRRVVVVVAVYMGSVPSLLSFSWLLLAAGAIVFASFGVSLPLMAGVGVLV